MRAKDAKPLPATLPPIFLSTIPPTPRQRLVAFGIVLSCFVALGAVLPFAHTLLPVTQNFTPVIDALLTGMLGIISFILVGQFLRLRTWSMLTLAAGFLFKLSMVGI